MVTKLLFLLFFLWPFNIFWPANNLDNLKTASNIPTTTLPPTRVTSTCVNPCRIWCAWWNMNSGGLLFICCRLAATITSRGRQTWGYRTKTWANQRKSARRSSNETLTTRTNTIQHLYNKRSLSENCLPHPYNYSPSYTCDIRICRSMPHLTKLGKVGEGVQNPVQINKTILHLCNQCSQSNQQFLISPHIFKATCDLK